MTRKESGWVSEPSWYAVVSTSHQVINKAIRREDVATEYADKCAENYPDATDIEVVPLYRSDALTSLQSAAEGLEVATVKALSWLCDERQGTWQYMEGSAIYSDMDALKNHLRTALSAFNAIKEK